MTIQEIDHDADENIILVGFMGTGKTTVGQQIADRLDRSFVDTDVMIATRAGMSIADIFAKEGEAGFRQREKEVCQQITAMRGLVVATGGGIILDKDNRALLLSRSFVVCLDAAPEVIAQRLSDTDPNRPLAANWREIYQARRDIYAEIPRHINTNNKSPEEVAGEIVAVWKQLNV